MEMGPEGAERVGVSGGRCCRLQMRAVIATTSLPCSSPPRPPSPSSIHSNTPPPVLSTLSNSTGL